MSTLAPLTHDLVRRVAAEEAAAAHASFDDVIGMAIGGAAALARRRAMVRLSRETGCTGVDLARVWGCNAAVPCRALKANPKPSGYDAVTAQRLAWAHGDDRARAILGGGDPATQADISAWHSLGGTEA